MTAPRVRLFQAVEASADLFLSRAHQTDQADDLSLPDREADGLERPFLGKVVDLQDHLIPGRRLLILPVTVRGERVPYHGLFYVGDARVRCRNLGDVLPVLHDHDPVGVLHDFLQAVGNKDDGCFLLDVPQDREECVSFPLGEDRRRLIQYEDGIRLPVQPGKPKEARDFHHLPHGRRHCRDGRFHADVDLDVLQEALGGRAHVPSGEKAEFAETYFVTEEQVFHDGQVRNKAAVLEHHPDPETRAIRGIFQRDRLAPQRESPAVGLNETDQDFHESGFPGAVLPDKADHLVRVHGEVHIVQGDDSRVGLAHLPQIEDGSALCHCRAHHVPVSLALI